MSLKKQYLKSKPVCKVTFDLDKKVASSAESVHLVGEFNNWNTDAHPMKKLKSGKFTATMNLETGKEYQYRYLLNKTEWVNDWKADKYVPTPFGNGDNSVVIL
jgi:1,4-alpha-glucan branching enzyme